MTSGFSLFPNYRALGTKAFRPFVSGALDLFAQLLSQGNLLEEHEAPMEIEGSPGVPFHLNSP